MNKISLATLLIALCALFATSSHAGGQRLQYLQEINEDAVSMYRCEASLDRIAKFVGEDGWDIGTDYRDTYKKAGDALVIKAALLVHDNGKLANIAKASFTSKTMEKRILSDIKAHEEVAREDVSEGSFDNGFRQLADCARLKSIDEARGLVDWLDNDVSFFEKLK